MKKTISLIVILAMLIGAISVGGFAVPAATYAAGDVNLDGTVSTYDARVLLSALVSNATLSASQMAAADINGDGDINTSDIKMILDVVMNAGDGTLVKNVNLLASDMDAWNNPVQTANNFYCTVKQTTMNEGVALVNVTETDLQPGNTGYNKYANPYTWPATGYAYESKYLVPSDAVIEYDFTVSSSAASVQLYLGGDRPFLDDSQYPLYITLNSFISSDTDVSSGDLKAGTYKGTIAVSDILSRGISQSCIWNDKLWISGIKFYVVGYHNEQVVVRTLKLSKAYQNARDYTISTDPYQAIKSDYVFTSETAGLSTLTGLEVHQNGERTLKNAFDYSADNKKIYYTETEKRIMNYPDGYQIDVPYDWTPDFSLSALRSRYTSDTCMLTVSKEEENPYDNWETYRDEWLIPYIGNESYLNENYLRYTRDPIVSETMLSGYTVMTYDIAIDWQGYVEMPYYSIAIIRKHYNYNTFYLMVLKSAVPTEGMIDRLIRSFKEITVYGSAVNVQGQYERIIPDTWSEETKAYYNKLCTQNSTDWGFFSHSMVEPADSNYGNRYDYIVSEQERLSTAVGYDFDIIPTYTHLGWASYRIPFPLEMAEDLAGGNGFNGKPVLQFTYQYTLTNNTILTGPTPIFNVLRGDYDEHFRQLAQDIKTYGKPILFRLNNEMNTDWTSYCGLLSLLDPDIFIMGWQRLYDIFEEEGVDNCIWIFNPFTPTTPYSSWGETLCYMPGAEYVQILGLTNYEMGNSSSMASFQEEYTVVYEESKDYFMNWPWVISEFACGAGGEKAYNWTYDSWETTTLGRYRYYQSNYISNMFNCLNNRAYYPFCQNIKAAIWFNRNDYVQIDGVDYIVNYLELDESSTSSLNAFKRGLAAQP